MGLMWKNGIKPHKQKKVNGLEYIALEASDVKDGSTEGLVEAEAREREKGEEEEEEVIDMSAIRGEPTPCCLPATERKWAVIVSWTSVIFAFFTGVAATVLGNIFESESLFGYGLDSVLDSFSSLAVLWRFFGNASAAVAEARERKACIVISFFFFASASSLIFKSTAALLKGYRDAEEEGRLLVLIFSSICGAVALVLGSAKVYLGLRLNSRSLLTDSIITCVGATMSFLGIAGMEIFREDNTIWYLDPVFGLCCGIFLFIFGLKILMQMTCLYPKHEPLHEDEE